MIAVSSGSNVANLNWVDFVFLLIFVYSVLTGAWIGFFAECISLAGVGVGTIAAGQTYNGVGSILGHIGVPKDARDWVGFVAVFIIISLIFRIGSIAARKLSKVMVRGVTNYLAGGMLGVLVGAMIVMFCIVTVGHFRVGKVYDPMIHSKIATNTSSWLQEYVTLLPIEFKQIPPFVS